MPFPNKNVAASGTKNTRKPRSPRNVRMRARAVVLPPHGPPVRTNFCTRSEEQVLRDDEFFLCLVGDLGTVVVLAVSFGLLSVVPLVEFETLLLVRNWLKMSATVAATAALRAIAFRESVIVGGR